jgi:hypothetical protein
LAVHAINYGGTRDVWIQIDKLPHVFTALNDGKLRFVKYQVDETHSNGIADQSYSGGPQKVSEGMLAPENGSVALKHARLTKNGILMWILAPEEAGTALSQPVSHPTLTVDVATRLPVLDVVKAVDSAQAEPQTRIERDGLRFRVFVTKSDGRPGITFPSPAGGWSMAGLKALEAKVRNTGRRTLPIHLALDGPGADRTHRKNCKITSETIPPGEEKTLAMPIVPVPPNPVEWLRPGKEKTFPYPESWSKDGYSLAKANAISIYVYHPGQEYSYEVSELRAIQDGPKE